MRSDGLVKRNNKARNDGFHVRLHDILRCPTQVKEDDHAKARPYDGQASNFRALNVLGMEDIVRNTRASERQGDERCFACRNDNVRIDARSGSEHVRDAYGKVNTCRGVTPWRREALTAVVFPTMGCRRFGGRERTFQAYELDRVVPFALAGGLASH